MDFYQRLPYGGGLAAQQLELPVVKISIHVPLAGDDPAFVSPLHDRDIFLSTSPLRGTTKPIGDSESRITISIHVPLAGDDFIAVIIKRSKAISIHVPLAGDDRQKAGATVINSISIHVPLAGDDSRIVPGTV